MRPGPAATGSPERDPDPLRVAAMAWCLSTEVRLVAEHVQAEARKLREEARLLRQLLPRQPDVGRCAGASRADVGVADVLAAKAFGPGLPQSTPTGHAGGLGLAPVTHRSQHYAARKMLWLSPSRSYHVPFTTPEVG